ncbi:MAG: hypothetical protein WBR15_00985 [Gammaproteobacteria bacterium]
MLILSLENVNQPDPHGLTIFEISKIPGVSGLGGFSYECPSCKSILLENVYLAELTQIAFRCPKCGALSRMHTSKRKHEEIPQQTPSLAG